MSSVRKNALVIDFSVVPIRPEIAKVRDFLENEIKLQYSDIRSIQLHHNRNCVFIEMISHEIAVRYQKEHNWRRVMLCGDVKFRIPIFVDCDAVTVRVHDLPPSMSHVTIADHMLKYGEVISIRNEKWKHYFPGIANGVRVLRMNLLRHIPSFITIETHETMVSYIDQPKSCRHCGQPSHPGGKFPDSNVVSSHQNVRTPTSTASKSFGGLFNCDDFSPINEERQTPSSPVHVNKTASKETTNQQKTDDDDWTDDDKASSSSTEHNSASNKRRRSRRNNAQLATKKACSDQCSPNADHAVQTLSPDEKEGSSKNKFINDVNYPIQNRK